MRAQFIGNNRAELKENADEVIVGQELVTGLTTNRIADVIEAAFQYNGLTGLNVDIGVKIPLQFDTDTACQVYPALNPNAPILNSDTVTISAQMPYSIALGASYSPSFLPALNLLFRVDCSFGGWALEPDSYKLTYGNIYSLWINPSYNISDTVSVGIDCGLEMHQADTYVSLPSPLPKDPMKTAGSDYFDKGFGPWIDLQVGGGDVKTGVMVMLPGSERWAYNSTNTQYPFQVLFTGDPVITIPISFTYSL